MPKTTPKTTMIKIGSVWKGQTKEGIAFYSGPISVPFPILLDKNHRILVFKNKSENERAPDLDILIAEATPTEEQSKTFDDDEALF